MPAEDPKVHVPLFYSEAYRANERHIQPLYRQVIALKAAAQYPYLSENTHRHVEHALAAVEGALLGHCFADVELYLAELHHRAERALTSGVMPACDHCGETSVIVRAQCGYRIGCEWCEDVTRELTGSLYVANPKDYPNSVKCRLCPRWTNLAHMVEEYATRLRAEQLCLRCDCFESLLTKDKVDRVVRIGGKHYFIEDDLPKNQVGMRGHGGHEFTIWFRDGRVVTTHNLWAQSTIPKHFLPRMPDNASFTKEAA